MKKIIFPMIAVLFLNLAGVASAKEWQKITEEQITSAVTYKKILNYDEGAFSMLHVLECETNDPAASLEVMTAEKGTAHLETTTEMTEKANAIAGVNGDFFNTGGTPTNTLGVLYNEGELLSTPSADRWATVAVTEAGDILMDYFGFEGTVTAPNGTSQAIYHINKVGSTAGAVNMYTTAWGETVDVIPDMMILFIKDGVVIDKIRDVNRTNFGDADTILTTNLTINSFFDNFNIGDEVEISYSITGTDESIKEAMGANTLLVEDGAEAKFNHNATGYAQRTALGINKEGTKLYLVVAEGRQSAYKGFSQSGFAKALIELGCYRAVNLDGGGSSTMVTKNELSGQVEKKNNVAAERKVSAAFGLFNRLPYNGVTKSGECIPSEATVLNGDVLDIYYKFHDANSHLVYPDEVKITTDSSADEVIGTQVRFNGGGVHTVYVTADRVTVSAEVYVIDNVASAELYPSNLDISEGKTANVSVTVWDSEGRKAYVHPDIVKWISEGVDANNGVISHGTGYVGVEFGEVRAYASVNGGAAPENTYLKNEFMDKLKEGKHLRISAGSKKYSSIGDMLRVLNFEYSLAGADYLYMLNAPLVKDIAYTSPDGFSKTTVDNTLIMTVNSSTGTIKEANQLTGLLQLKNVREKNIIIVTEKTPAALHESEKELFFESLAAARRAGKNIFVVYEDENAKNFTEEGICFIACESHSGADAVTGRTVDFYISGDNISYSL